MRLPVRVGRRQSSTAVPPGTAGHWPACIPTQYSHMVQPPQPAHRGWTSRGYLPHFDAADTWQSITYRLADAMPRHVIAGMERDLTIAPDDERDRQRRRRVEAWLDAGHGSCVLRRDDIAALILETWTRFAGSRYDLGPWVIMPNHVHLLIRVNPGHTLATSVGSWKSYTAKRIMALAGMSAPIWWPEYWDRFIRDEAHWRSVGNYIERNPVVAGLARSPQEWRWGSAGQG